MPTQKGRYVVGSPHMRVAAQLTLRPGDEARLRRMAVHVGGNTGLARRASIVLLAAEGLPHTEVAERTGTSLPTVRYWRSRYQTGGIAALMDRPRPGRPRNVDESRIVAVTLSPPPARLGAKRWSSRLLARELGISAASVIEVWHKWGLRPWRGESFAFATAPRLEANLTDVVGLYLRPPEKAVVVRPGETRLRPPPDCAQQQSRSALPGPPLQDINLTISSLLASLGAATGQVVTVRQPHDGAQLFLQFHKKVANAWPGHDLHVVSDHTVAWRHPWVREWLAGNPQIIEHHTVAGYSWLELVEIFLLLSHPEVCWARDRPIDQIMSMISSCATGWTEGCRPFVWIKGR